MLPHQFKRLMELLRIQFGTVNESIREHADAASEKQAANSDEIRNISGSLGIIARELQSKDQKDNAAYDKTYRQQERLIALQRRLALWAMLAFWAAFAYGAVAFWQGCQTSATYREMQKQTKESQWSAYWACRNAQSALLSLEEARRSTAYGQAMATASAAQMTEQSISNRAYLIFTGRFPEPSEMIPTQLMIPYDLKNIGTSGTTNFRLKAQAILVGRSQKFTPTIFNNKYTFTAKAPYYPPSNQIPAEQKQGSQYHPRTDNMYVVDIAGNPVNPTTDKTAQDFLRASDNGDTAVFLFGTIRYEDFATTYNVKFCQPISLMLPGTTRTDTDNEKICTQYAHADQEYHYSKTMPKFSDTLNPQSPITCTVPTD